MNIDNFKKYIDDRLKTFIANGDKKNTGDFRHHKTSLNNITKKYALVSDSTFQSMMFDQFDTLLENYENAIVAANKASTSSPLTRLKNLQELYAGLVQPIHQDETTLSKLLLDAAKKLYGDKFYTGPVDNYHKIQAQYLTIASLCRNIVSDAIKKQPHLFANAHKNQNSFNSAAKKIKEYFTGESLPSTRVPKERLHFIEDYLGIKRDSISERAFGRYSVKKKSDLNVERRNKAKSPKRVTRKKFSCKELNSHLQAYFDEYKAFKIDGIEPVLRNVTQEMRDDEYAEYMLNVEERTSKHIKNWTKNGKGEYPSASGFYSVLKAFLNYCVEEKNIDFEDVTTSHLTSPRILIDFANWSSKGNAPHSAQKLLNAIYISCQQTGYLRLCGDTGERSLEKFNKDLDFIQLRYPKLMELAEKGKVLSKNRTNPTGQENIRFLLEMHWRDRRNVVYQASFNMLKQANYFINEAKKGLSRAARTTRDEAKHKKEVYAATCADKAMSLATTALITETCFLSAPRATTLAQLRYFPSEAAKEPNTPCIVYHSHKGCFEIDVPVYGYDIGNNYEVVRLLKNSESKDIRSIHATFPADMTPLFKTFLQARKLYIDTHMTTYIKVWLTKYDAHIELINKADISEESRAKYLQSMIDNKKVFEEFDPENVNMLFPYFAYRTKPDIKDDLPRKPDWEAKLMVKRAYARPSTKLGEDFAKATCDAFADLLPSESNPAVNIHATRHLSAITYLDEHKGAYRDVAAIINDNEEQVVKTYGNKDRAIVMRELSANYTNKDRSYDV